MTRTFRRRSSLAGLLFALLSTTDMLLAANGARWESEAQVLADQVKRIVQSPNLEATKKERLIAQVVRTAVISSTINDADSTEKVEQVILLAGAAAQAAPAFRETITKAASLAPGIRSIPGASSSIRSGLASYGAQQKRVASPTSRTSSEVRLRTQPKAKQPHTNAERKVARRVPSTATYVSVGDESTARETARPRSAQQTATRGTPKRVNPNEITFEKKGNITWILDANVRHDNNVYLTKDNRESDTVYALRPGVEIKSDRQARLQGQLRFTEAFTRSARGTSPNETLANGDAEMTYSDGRTRFGLSASVDQSNQNNRDVVINGRRSIFRTDQYEVQSTFELPLSPRSTVGLGAGYNIVNYPDGVFRDNRSWDLPLNYFYALSPKVDLSAGVSYRRTTVDQSPDRSSAWYYSVGARGEFTQRLQGSFSVGYRRLSSSAVGSTSDGTLGLQSALTWSASPKTTVTLNLLRDFRTSSQGQSITNLQTGLSLQHATTLFWQNGFQINYGTFEYGPALFSGGVAYLDRTDKFTEGTLFTRYQINRWFNTALNVSFRSNQSNLPGVEFNGMLTSLLFGLTY